MGGEMVSFVEIVGTIKQKMITRKSKDITILVIVSDKQEIVIRHQEPLQASSFDNFLNQRVKTEGVIDGSIFFIHTITAI
jgi:hypothetical protein